MATTRAAEETAEAAHKRAHAEATAAAAGRIRIFLLAAVFALIAASVGAVRSSAGNTYHLG